MIHSSLYGDFMKPTAKQLRANVAALFLLHVPEPALMGEWSGLCAECLRVWPCMTVSVICRESGLTTSQRTADLLLTIPASAPLTDVDI